MFAVGLQKPLDRSDSSYDGTDRTKWFDAMITTQVDSPFEIILPAETLDPPLTPAARLIRGALLLGFMAVMATEAWLLWQVWRLIG